jgi:hypothetical protein
MTIMRATTAPTLTGSDAAIAATSPYRTPAPGSAVRRLARAPQIAATTVPHAATTHADVARAPTEPADARLPDAPPRPAAGDRPRLRLMRSEAPVADAPAPAPAPASQPATPTAQLLARATTGAIEYEDDGRMSVLFPPPGSVLAPGATIAREESAPTAMPAAAPSSAEQAQPTVTGAPQAAPAAAPLDRDELYADFMRRLRRDVLEQREQLGAL